MLLFKLLLRFCVIFVTKMLLPSPICRLHHIEYLMYAMLCNSFRGFSFVKINVIQVLPAVDFLFWLLFSFCSNVGNLGTDRQRCFYILFFTLLRTYCLKLRCELLPCSHGATSSPFCYSNEGLHSCGLCIHSLTYFSHIVQTKIILCLFIWCAPQAQLSPALFYSCFEYFILLSMIIREKNPNDFFTFSWF